MVKHYLRTVSLSVVVLLCSCTTQLAPPYDQAISDGLVSANKDTQALFVSIGTLVTKDTYASRAPAYNHFVSELKAVELQIKSRPMPSSDALAATNKFLAKVGTAGIAVDPNFSDYPSARSVDDLVGTIQHMQSADQSNGLRGGELSAFENQATIYLTQAITYESFLKR